VADDTTTESLELQGPGGWRGRLSGKRIVDTLILLIVLMGLALIYVQHTGLASEHSTINQSIRVQTCVLSLTQAERIQLRESRAFPAALVYYCPWLGTP